ncbi:IS3 family transposase [Adhaeribacter swui]|nr:IS3 family transposase [Adhaeribacter swui]
MERGILKKLSVSFPREAGNLPVYSRAQGQIFPPEKICKVFQVNRSSYYTYLAGAVSQRAQANKNLLAMIKEVHQKSKQHYGSPRIQQVLKAHKMQVFRSRVACLMQQAGASGNEEKKI